MKALDRRAALRFLGMAGIAAGSMALPAQARANCPVPARQHVARPQAAVSLRGLARDAERCGSQGGCAAFNPMGLTRLDGFVIDPKEQDVVLWGLREAGTPPLMLDDFLVGLRAAFEKYVVIENGKLVLYRPGISIDPQPALWRKLDDIPFGGPEQDAAYAEACRAPQVLRVDGMPRHTRVSDILLAADYRMKLVVQGKSSIPFDGFFGSAAERRRLRAAMAQAAGLTFPPHPGEWNRWWFHAGDFTYQAGPKQDVVFMDRAQVSLSVRFVQKDGSEIVGEGEIEHAYTCDWNAAMEEVVAAERLWGEMMNVFRHFALAKIIFEQDALKRAGMPRRDVDLLLEGLPIARVPIPDTIPGSELMSEVQVTGGQPLRFRHCGGVSVGFDDDTLRASPDRAPELGRAAGAILAGRAGHAAWDVHA